MIPYCFADFGKNVRTILEENFHTGGIKFTHSSKTASDINLIINAEHKSDSGHVTADINASFEPKGLNLTFDDTYSSDGIITSSVTSSGNLIEGGKGNIKASFEPNTGKFTAKVTNSLERKGINLACESDFVSNLPIVTASAVFGRTCPLDMMIGGQLVFDTKHNNLQKHALGLNFRFHDDCEMSTTFTNSNILNSYISHKVNNKLETGLHVNYTYKSRSTRMAFGLHYTLPKGAFWKAKFDNVGLLGLAYGFDVSNNVKLILGASVDGKNIESGKHQVGAALQFEA